MNTQLPDDLPRRAEFTMSHRSHGPLGQGGGYFLRGRRSEVALIPILGKKGVAPNHQIFSDRWHVRAFVFDNESSDSDGCFVSGVGPDLRTACEKAARRIRLGSMVHDFAFMDVLDWKQEVAQ